MSGIVHVLYAVVKPGTMSHWRQVHITTHCFQSAPHLLKQAPHLLRQAPHPYGKPCVAGILVAGESILENSAGFFVFAEDTYRSLHSHLGNHRQAETGSRSNRHIRLIITGQLDEQTD